MQINIEKKHLYLILAIMIFLVGVGVVIAIGGGVDPAIHGHATTSGFLIDDINVPLTFKESDETGAGSLWRMPLDAKHLRFDSSNNGVNFTPYTTPLDLYSNGKVKIKDLEVTGSCTGCGGGSTIPCDWTGWKGAMTFAVEDGKKHEHTYYTTIFNCQGGVITGMKYVLCATANSVYGAGIDCTE